MRSVHSRLFVAISVLTSVVLSAGVADAKPKKKPRKPAAAAEAAPSAPAPAPAPAPLPAPEPAPAPRPVITTTPSTPKKPVTDVADSTEPDTTPPVKTRGTTLDIAPALTLPVGLYSLVTGVGFGGFVGVRHPIIKRLDFSARAGFVYHLSKDYGYGSYGTAEVPILGGVRFTFVPNDSGGGFYGNAELGLSVIFTRGEVRSSSLLGYYDLEPKETSGTSTTIGLSHSLGVGYQAGHFDARASLFFVDVGRSFGGSMMLMASVGYSFAEF